MNVAVSVPFTPGTLVRLCQTEMFQESGVFVVLGSSSTFAQDQFGKNEVTCRLLQSATGRVVEWYADFLEEIS